ncbi:MAG TPA: NRDE family protein [Longimicrobiaceae bacterium]|jgi:uncharacterized protein with NRDE domain
MCLILLAHEAHPRYRLVVAANRDEAYARPTAPAAWWADAPGVLAGRDLLGGGTWMGISRGGRFAAVTNFRETAAPPPDAPTRGRLVGDFLRGAEAPDAYLRALAARAGEYAGFNLLVGDGGGLRWFSNRGGAAQAVEPGIHGLSNALLDTPWPKVDRGRDGLAAALLRDDVDPEALFRVLRDAEPAPDEHLPDTGVGLERERVLSSPFIRSPEYGTRASTVLLVGRDGQVRFVERTVTPGRDDWAEAAHEFRLDGAGAAPSAR